MTTEEMRAALIKLYPGPKWKYRVDRMTEQQVFAVYSRMKRENKL